MALVVRTQGIVEQEVIQPDLRGSALDIQALEYSLRPFAFRLTVQLREQRQNIPQLRTSTNGSGQREHHFTLPVHRPISGVESWRIGIVQNVLERKSVARWGTPESQPETLLHLDGRRLLDTAATHAQPFIYDPRVRYPGGDPSGIRRAEIPGTSRNDLPSLIQSGFDLYAYPNGVLSIFQDPWQDRAPLHQQSDVYLCEFNDVPGGIAPLHCEEKLLREIRVAQTQQWFLALSRNGGSFEPLLATGVFTTYFYAQLTAPVRGRSVEGPNLAGWRSMLVPWDEPLESFPVPSATSNNNEFWDNWRIRRWQEIRRTRTWARRQAQMGVVISTPDRMTQLGIPTNMVSSGQTANEWLNDRTDTHPCLTELLNRLDHDRAQSTVGDNVSRTNNSGSDQPGRLTHKQRQAQAFAGLAQLDSFNKNGSQSGKPFLRNRAHQDLQDLDAYKVTLRVPESLAALEGDLIDHIAHFVGTPGESYRESQRLALERAVELVMDNQSLESHWITLAQNIGEGVEFEIQYVFRSEESNVIERIWFFIPTIYDHDPSEFIVEDLREFMHGYRQRLRQFMSNESDMRLAPERIVRRMVVFRDAVWFAVSEPQNDPNSLRTAINIHMRNNGRVSDLDTPIITGPFDEGIEFWNGINSTARERFYRNSEVAYPSTFVIDGDQPRSIDLGLISLILQYFLVIDTNLASNIMQILSNIRHRPYTDPLDDTRDSPSAIDTINSLNRSGCARLSHIQSNLVPLVRSQLRAYNGVNSGSGISPDGRWSMCP